jgi:hypothetical protein
MNARIPPASSRAAARCSALAARSRLAEEAKLVNPIPIGDMPETPAEVS